MSRRWPSSSSASNATRRLAASTARPKSPAPARAALRNVVGTLSPEDVAMDDSRPRSNRRHLGFVIAAMASIAFAAAAVQSRFAQDTVLLVTGIAAFTIDGDAGR